MFESQKTAEKDLWTFRSPRGHLDRGAGSGQLPNSTYTLEELLNNTTLLQTLTQFAYNAMTDITVDRTRMESLIDQHYTAILERRIGPILVDHLTRLVTITDPNMSPIVNGIIGTFLPRQGRRFVRDVS